MSRNSPLILPKLTLIITTRCNLKCRLCCEYVPQNKPFPDMTLDEEEAILAAAFDVVDRVETLHLSGGGEPFLHPGLAEMIDLAFEYEKRFDRFMLFTNSTVPVSNKLLETFKRYGEKLIVHASDYGISPERTSEIYKLLTDNGVHLRTVRYCGDEQDYGGWVDFGAFLPQNRTPEELERIFHSCAVARDMRGNWRTRDGKVHWCSRSQRGTELGLIPDWPDCYVDLFDASNREEKRRKFRDISKAQYLSACDYCSGDQGTNDTKKRFRAAQQLEVKA